MTTFRLRLLVFALILVTPLVLASGASAHVDFESSNPAEGSVVDGPVEAIDITFTDTVSPVAEQFAALDPESGLREPTSVESTNMRTWTLRFEPPLNSGEIAVRWTVQSEDAHVISGGMAFTAAASAPVPALVSARPDVEAAKPHGRSSGSSVAFGPAPAVAESIDVNLAAAIDEPALGQLSSVEVGLTSADAFIDQGRSNLATGAFVGALGRAIGYTAAMAAIGGFIFAQLILRRRRDLENAVVWLRRFGVLIMVGALCETVGQVMISFGQLSFAGLAELLGSTAGLSMGIRFLGGLAWWGLPEPRLVQVVGHAQAPMAPQTLLLSSVVGTSAASVDRPSRLHRSREVAATFSEYRWQSGAATGLAVLGLTLLTASHLFDGHTLSEGNRLLASFATVAHVIGGAVWGGGVIMLAATLWNRRRDSQPLEAMELGIRFSIVASAALVVVGAAGLALTWMIIDSVAALWTTPWGRLLAVKTLAVALAGALGIYNHRRLLPRTVRGRSVIGATSTGSWLRFAVGIEALTMTVVLVVTAFLVGAAS